MELIKRIEDGVHYSIDEIENIINNENNNKFREFIKKELSGNTALEDSVNSHEELLEIIKSNFKGYCLELGHHYPVYQNALSVICCILLEN